MARTLDSKNVLITGGSKNLGAGFAIDLAKHGVRAVGIHYNSAKSLKDAEETARKVEEAGAKAFLYQADLTARGAMEDLFKSAKEDMGSIDIAINCAGVLYKRKIVDTTEEEIENTLNVNTKGGFLFLKYAGIYVSDNGNVLSIVTSLMGGFQPLYGSYTGSKAAIEHFTRAAAKEFGERGISVNCLGPGPINNEFFYAGATPQAAAFLKSNTALGEFSASGLCETEDLVPWPRFL
eukprot:CAMPEP_0171588156 /NCGR_PEP_ID=MMETSP0961-20121227/13909_1 /TAXON_ID=87120 /ORGANISM="Aurantiochytrium limacinum, Strain ATCCMYA-1381" /LENGTH=235 /DNA_ID=CAMNT_0012146857 /DNA_START=84 /DNA_END=787 /DNA_ORIENTATION=+